MKQLINNLIGKVVTIHFKSREILAYQQIIGIVDNTLITSCGNTTSLIEISHIGDVIVNQDSNLSAESLIYNMSNKGKENKNNGDKKN